MAKPDARGKGHVVMLFGGASEIVLQKRITQEDVVRREPAQRSNFQKAVKSFLHCQNLIQLNFCMAKTVTPDNIPVANAIVYSFCPTAPENTKKMSPIRYAPIVKINALIGDDDLFAIFFPPLRIL